MSAPRIGQNARFVQDVLYKFSARKTWGGGRKVKGCKTSFTRRPETENSPYDEKIHKRNVDMIPTAELRNALDSITVKVLGAKETTAKISAVTDTATGLADGTLTIGDDVLIEGEKVKVDEKDPLQGVFFVSEDGTEHKTERRLSLNKPTQILARVPKTLPEGKVTVKVRTKFTGGSGHLKELREIVYGYECIAKS